MTVANMTLGGSAQIGQRHRWSPGAWLTRGCAGHESLPAAVLGKKVPVDVGAGAETIAVQSGEHVGSARSAPPREHVGVQCLGVENGWENA